MRLDATESMQKKHNLIQVMVTEQLTIMCECARIVHLGTFLQNAEDFAIIENLISLITMKSLLLMT